MVACPPKPQLKDRPLLTIREAGDASSMFRVLANDTRLRMIHALVRHGEMTVTALAEAIGAQPQAVSNQLQRMAARCIVAGRRQGNNIHYHVENPCVVVLLERVLCLLEEAAAKRSTAQA
jgi:DNA-binding transcriptional ArsR family regulator